MHRSSYNSGAASMGLLARSRLSGRHSAPSADEASAPHFTSRNRGTDVSVSSVAEELNVLAGMVRRRDWNRAIRTAKAWLRDEPDQLAVMENLAVAAWNKGDSKLLLATAKRMLRLHPSEPGYLYLKGMALLAQGMASDAIDAFECALQHLPQGRLLQEIREAIERTDEWQSSIVQLLLESDALFRALFQRDPMEACKQRGIKFSWDLTHHDLVTIGDRPTISVQSTVH